MNRNKKIIQKIVLGGVIVNQDNKILILQRNKSKKNFQTCWNYQAEKENC